MTNDKFKIYVLQLLLQWFIESIGIVYEFVHEPVDKNTDQFWIAVM
jgi:hypothetical protein